MQWTGQSAPAGVPTQQIGANAGMGASAARQYIAGVWQSAPHTLELNNDGAAHPKVSMPAEVMGVGSTLEPAHNI